MLYNYKKLIEGKMQKSDKETEEQISQLQIMEQAFQNLSLQKQNFQMQLIEIESALEELEKTEKAYKIVGNIMVASDKEALKSELESKKETLNIRIKNLEKQEKDFKEKSSSLQKQILEKLGKKEE